MPWLKDIPHAHAYCTLHRENCTLYSEHCTLHIAHCILFTAYCTFHAVHCTLHTAHWKLHTEHYTLHTAHCNTALCILNTAHSTLRIQLQDHCTFQSLFAAGSMLLSAACCMSSHLRTGHNKKNCRFLLKPKSFWEHFDEGNL